MNSDEPRTCIIFRTIEEHCDTKTLRHHHIAALSDTLNMTAMEQNPKRQRLNYSKCTCCRKDKKKVCTHSYNTVPASREANRTPPKCTPPGREWPQKCDRCLCKRLECSPSTDKKAGGYTRRAKTRARSGSLAPAGALGHSSRRQLINDGTIDEPDCLELPDSVSSPGDLLRGYHSAELNERVESWKSKIHPGPSDQSPPDPPLFWHDNFEGVPTREVPLGDSTRNKTNGGQNHEVVGNLIGYC